MEYGFFIRHSSWSKIRDLVGLLGDSDMFGVALADYGRLELQDWYE